MKTIVGDLLEIRAGIILHQVNCMGAVGGLAGALHRKWPKAFAPYFTHCDRLGAGARGSAVIGEGAPGLFIAHVFGQVSPGANTDLAMADRALESLAEEIISTPAVSALPVFAPYLMGCGLGGGRWEEYAPLLEKHFPALTLVKLP